MRTTPLDIRNQVFGKRLRGYDPTEVSTFLELVADQMEELLAENSSLRARFEEYSRRLQDFQDREGIIKESIVNSQKQAEETQRNAQHRAELIIREAGIERERILREAYEKIERLRRHMANLKELRDGFVTRFIAFLETHRRLVEELSEAPDIPLLPTTDARELSDADIDRVVEKFKAQVGFEASAGSNDASDDRE